MLCYSPLCNKAFGRQDSLVRHLRVHVRGSSASVSFNSPSGQSGHSEERERTSTEDAGPNAGLDSLASTAMAMDVPGQPPKLDHPNGHVHGHTQLHSVHSDPSRDLYRPSVNNITPFYESMAPYGPMSTHLPGNGSSTVFNSTLPCMSTDASTSVLEPTNSLEEEEEEEAQEKLRRRNHNTTYNPYIQDDENNGAQLPYSELWALDLASLQAYCESTAEDNRLSSMVSDLFASSSDSYDSSSYIFDSSNSNSSAGGITTPAGSSSLTPLLGSGTGLTIPNQRPQSQYRQLSGGNTNGNNADFTNKESSLSENEQSEAFRQAHNLLSDVVCIHPCKEVCQFHANVHVCH